MRDPNSKQQWQEAADAAYAMLHLHSATVYGLVRGAPQIDVERCEEILGQARDQGILPRPDALDRLLTEIA